MSDDVNISIGTDNAAFDDGNAGVELARILTGLAERVSMITDDLSVLDGLSLRRRQRQHGRNGVRPVSPHFGATLAMMKFALASSAVVIGTAWHMAQPPTVALTSSDDGQGDVGIVLTMTLPCDYEDGRVDGAPCHWIDPDTGDVYLSDSANYR